MSLGYSRNAADSSGADDAATMEEVLVTWNDSEEMQAVQYSIVTTTRVLISVTFEHAGNLTNI